MFDEHRRSDMNAEQKQAWLAVITGIICILGYAALVPFVGFGPATAVMAIYAINGLTPLIWKPGNHDERDIAILQRATLAGGIASYMAFIIGTMGIWAIVFAWHRQNLVSVHALPTLAIFGMIVLFFVRSIVVLVLYGKHVEGGDA